MDEKELFGTLERTMYYKYVYVILHYSEKTVNDTCECVHSIQGNIENKDYHIVVVENGSGDRSFELLNETFKTTENVTLINSKENLGFARGNNMGCDYAVKNFSPEYLIVINNDTMIYQKDFLDKVDNIYKEYHFHILGPYIQDRMGHPQNPVKSFPVTIEDVDKSIFKLEYKQQILNRGCFRYWLIFKLTRVLKKYLKKISIVRFFKSRFTKSCGTDELSLDIQRNIGLHGSALIFSKDYFEKYDNVFYPATFMFKEEDILYYRVKQHNLTSLYHPGLKIHHKEDRSTDTAFAGSCEKEKYIISNQLESFRIFREYIVKDQCNG